MNAACSAGRSAANEAVNISTRYLHKLFEAGRGPDLVGFSRLGMTWANGALAGGSPAG